MWEIKEYKPIALVFYIDGNGNRSALPLDDSKREQFKAIVETSKMVELEWVIISTFEIKEIKPAWKISELEKYYYSRDYKERSLISQRVKSRCQNQRVNVLESLAEMWTEKAIRLMENRIHPSIEEEKKEEVNTESRPMTEEEKAEIKAKFKKFISSKKL